MAGVGDVFRRAKCRLLGHDVVAVYITEATCERRSTCRRAGCPWQQEDVEHQFGASVPKPTKSEPCRRVATCGRCGERAASVVHDYGPVAPAPTAGNPCRHVRNCARCDKSDVSVLHDYGPPTPDASDPCTFVSTCTRSGCNATTSKVDHDYTWSWPKAMLGPPSEQWCEKRDRCSRCDALEAPFGDRRIEHDWGDWQVGPDGRTFQLCRRDGARRDKP